MIRKQIRNYIFHLQVTTSVSLLQHLLTMIVLMTLNWSIYMEVRKRTKWLEKAIPKNPKTDYRRREITIALLLVTVILRCFVSLVELLAVVLVSFLK